MIKSVISNLEKSLIILNEIKATADLNNVCADIDTNIQFDPNVPGMVEVIDIGEDVSNEVSNDMSNDTTNDYTTGLSCCVVL